MEFSNVAKITCVISRQLPMKPKKARLQFTTNKKAIFFKYFYLLTLIGLLTYQLSKFSWVATNEFSKLSFVIIIFTMITTACLVACFFGVVHFAILSFNIYFCWQFALPFFLTKFNVGIEYIMLNVGLLMIFFLGILALKQLHPIKKRSPLDLLAMDIIKSMVLVGACYVILIALPEKDFQYYFGEIARFH